MILIISKLVMCIIIILFYVLAHIDDILNSLHILAYFFYKWQLVPNLLS